MHKTQLMMHFSVNLKNCKSQTDYFRRDLMKLESLSKSKRHSWIKWIPSKMNYKWSYKRRNKSLQLYNKSQMRR